MDQQSQNKQCDEDHEQNLRDVHRHGGNPAKAQDSRHYGKHKEKIAQPSI